MPRERVEDCMASTQDHAARPDGPDIRPGSEPYSFNPPVISPNRNIVVKQMEVEAESPILTRFEKHDEFVALQNEALSLDDGTLASDEEERRRTKLMWNIFNIVRIVVSRRPFSSRF